MEDCLLDYDLTCLLASTSLRYIGGLAQSLSVIIKNISPQYGFLNGLQQRSLNGSQKKNKIKYRKEMQRSLESPGHVP